MGMVDYTNDGVVCIAGEDTGKLGFGMASGIRATSEVLEVVSSLNRLMPFGHFWLAPGSDDDHWSLICGFKFRYDLVSPDYVIEVMVAMINHNGALIDAVRQQLNHFPHEEYWVGDSTAGAEALLLVGHLG